LRAGERGFAPALILGSAIGLGLLAKYAMLYFLIGLAFAALIDRPTRQAIVSRQGLIAGLIGAALFAPHVLWNMANDFKTVSHTVDNANLGGDLFNPENFLTFLTDQAGVFGPVAFLTLLIGLFVMRTGTPDGKSVDRWLLCFILPVLVFILAQSVISRANANWAATAYPAASILVVRWLRRAAPNARLWQIVSGLTFLAMLAIPDLSWPVKIIMAALIGGGLFGLGHVMKQRPAGLIGAGLVLNGMLALLFVVLMVLPPAATSALGFDNAVKRAKGWKEIALQVMATAEAEGASAVLVDEREVWHAFDYYARERTIPMISWRRYPGPKSFSETVPLQGALARRVLVASYHEDLRPHLRSDFQRFDYIGKVQVDLGRRSNGCRIKRTIALYIAEGHAPPPRTPEWEARFVGQREYAEPACVK
jgi:4-amino-4-deoxy-L-arabinose transferase-like glycosyltransferase